jgi:hypothetical protein
MAITKFRLNVSSFAAANNAGIVGAADWQITGTLRNVASGVITNMGSGTAEVKNGQSVNVGWAQEVTVDPKDTTYELNVNISEIVGTSATDKGKIRATFRVPLMRPYQLHLLANTGLFTVWIVLGVLERTADAAGQITTIVTRDGGSTYNTIHSEMTGRMAQIHPVIPVPAWDLPPFTRGAATLSASDPETLNATAASTDLNTLVNPAVIAVLDPADPDFDTKVARVRVTQFRPDDLDTDKFIWQCATSNIKFRAGGKEKTEVRGGREVKVYGVQDGDADTEAKIELHWDSPGTPLLATFRALVGKPKYIVTRANVIKCSSATDPGGVPILNPTATADDIKKHLAFSNVLLWQMAVQLVFDTNATCYNGAVLKDTGIFEVSSATNYTFNVTLNGSVVATILNSRANVFNLGYLHSCAGKPTLLGVATDRRLSAASTVVESAGTPSDSFVRPTGIFPDDDAKPIKITTMGPSNARNNAQKNLCGDGAIDKICGCLITANDHVANGSVTMAHELGHVIGLNHRGNGAGSPNDGSVDGVNHLAGPNKGRGHPWIENCMTYGNDLTAQDFDIGQAKIVRAHKLLVDKNPNAVPPPAPQQPKPVPESKLPTEADRKLLQGYLSGKTPGLQNSGYDIGTSGPNGDGIDGIVGPKTKQAIRDFQQAHGGLTVDGIYGPKTKAAFNEELNGA